MNEPNDHAQPYTLQDLADELFELEQRLEARLSEIRAKIGKLSRPESDAVLEIVRRKYVAERGEDFAADYVKKARAFMRLAHTLNKPEDES